MARINLKKIIYNAFHCDFMRFLWYSITPVKKYVSNNLSQQNSFTPSLSSSALLCVSTSKKKLYYLSNKMIEAI